MPRLAPHRHWNLDITEMEGARPQAGRSYPVASQHLPELNRQIEVLERAGIIRRSKSLYGAPVFFAPKKDGKLRLCIDYRIGRHYGTAILHLLPLNSLRGRVDVRCFLN